MQSKHQANFRPLQNQHQMMQKQVKNPNKTLAWSSINSNSGNYQEIISPRNYKLSNPSSSMIMSSLSNIYENCQNDIETTESTDYQNVKMLKKDNYHKRNGSENNEFYHYLMQQNRNHTENASFENSLSLTNNQKKIDAFEEMRNKWPNNKQQNPTTINTQDEYIVLDNKSNYTLMNYNQQFSAEESLIQLQQSQQELTFLKYKLQEAYQKLERQILNSYGLEEKIESLRTELESKEELMQLQKTENEKLKFTLRAIMKNKSFLEEQMQKDESKSKERSQSERQYELKENLKLKLQLKDLQQKIKEHINNINQLKSENKMISQQLSQKKKQTERLMNETLKKDHYLQTLSQQLQTLQDLRTENKKLLLKQSQYLNKINVLQLQLRKVTDEKVTSVGRLKHEIALVHKHNEELLEENDSLNHQTFINSHHAYSPASLTKRTPNNSSRNVSVNKNNKIQNQKTPLIFDSEEQDQRLNNNHQIANSKQHVNIFTLKNDQIITKRKESQQNKQNVASQNLQQSYINQSKCSELSKIQKSVGKWKRTQSISNNSSVYFESGSNEHQNINEQIQAKQKMPEKECPTQKFIESKLSAIVLPESQDQKLSKYQQHRKNIENELMNLEKMKRPSNEERERIQRLQKQLYYLDSDIAGLKRKIRRKY